MKDWCEYKGVVALIKGDYYLFMERKNGEPTDSIPISNTNNVYSKLKNTQLQLVSVLLFDGTEPMELEYILENRPNFEDIFIKIKDLDLITIIDNTEIKEVNIINLINDNSFYDIFKELMEQITLT